MNHLMKDALDGIAARHGFTDAHEVASVVPNSMHATGVLMQEVRHSSRHPSICIHDIEHAHLDGYPTPRLLRAFDEMARSKRSLIRRETAMAQAGLSRLKTPYWALRTHRLALMLVRHAGARYTGNIRLNPIETDPTAPAELDDGWKVSGGLLKGNDDSYELNVDAVMQGDMLMYDCITIVGMPADETTALLTTTWNETRLSVRKDVPETLMPLLVGRDVADVVSHPAWGDHAGIRILEAEIDHGGDVPWLDLTLEHAMEWIDDVPDGIDASWRS